MHEFRFAQATNPMGDKEEIMKPVYLTLLLEPELQPRA